MTDILDTVHLKLKKMLSFPRMICLHIQVVCRKTRLALSDEPIRVGSPLAPFLLKTTPDSLSETLSVS